MRRFLLLTCLVVWSIASAGSAQTTGLIGVWEGEAETRPWTSFLTLTLSENGDAELRLGSQTLPVVVASRTPQEARLRLGPSDDSPSLALRADGSNLVGDLAFGGQTASVRLRRVPDYPTPTSRDEAWRQDLGALETRFLAADRSFDAHERQTFLEHIAALRTRTPALSDAEIILGMASAIATGGNAHTRLYLLRNRTELRRLPIRVWTFGDGLYVIRATNAHANLLGCRVVGIGARSIAEAQREVAPAFAGNASWARYMSTYTLTSPEALVGMGVTSDVDNVDWQFDGCATAAARLQPLPLEKSGSATESWWDLAPDRFTDLAGWSHALSTDVPLYLRETSRNYRFLQLDAANLIYFQFNRAAEMPDETIESFGDRLLAALNVPEAPGLVLDLRFNTGGNLDLARELMTALEEKTRGRRRYVIIGNTTFSAGLTSAASWREAGQTTFVGEAAGDDLDYWAEGGNIVLPNSGLYAHFANGAHSYSPAPCPADVPCLELSAPPLGPDVPAPLSWAQYAAGIDPAMEAILADMCR